MLHLKTLKKKTSFPLYNPLKEVGGEMLSEISLFY